MENFLRVSVVSFLVSVSVGILVGQSKSPKPGKFPGDIKEQEKNTWLFSENFQAVRR